MIKFKTNEIRENFELMRSEFLKDNLKNEWATAFLTSVPDSIEFEASIFSASNIPNSDYVDMYNVLFQTRDSNSVHSMSKILDENSIFVDLTDFYVGTDIFLEDFAKSNQKPYDNFFWTGFNFNSGRRVIKFYFCFSGCDTYFEHLLNTYHGTTVEDFCKITGVEKQNQRFVTYYFEDGKPVQAVVRLFVNDEYKQNSYITGATGIVAMESATKDLQIDSIQLEKGKASIDEVCFLATSVEQAKKYIGSTEACNQLAKIEEKIIGNVSYIVINREKLSVVFLPTIDYCRDKIEMVVTGSAARINEIDSLIESKKLVEAEELCLTLINKYGDGNGLNYRLARIYGKGGMNKPELAKNYFMKEKLSTK